MSRRLFSLAVATTLAFSGLSAAPNVLRHRDGRTESIPLKLSAGRSGVTKFGAKIGLVAASWDGPADAAQIRTRHNGYWSGWTTLHALDTGPDTSSTEYRTRRVSEPLLARRGDVQVRFTDSARAGNPKLHLIDPGDDPPSGAAWAISTPPGIISRAQWGADPNMRRGNPTYGKVQIAVVHHTATGNDYSPDEADDVVRSIHRYHFEANGWDDIGYNLLVDRYGRVYEGRAGGVDRAVIGAQAQGFNSVSTGIAFIGDGSVAIPQAARDALLKTVSWKLDIHHVDPTKSYTVKSGGSDVHPKGSQPTLRAVSGHRDVRGTACPGDSLYSILNSVATDARALGMPKIFDVTQNTKLVSLDGDGVRETVTLGWTMAEGVRWGVEVIDSQNQVRKATQGTGSGTYTWDGKDTAGNKVKQGPVKLRIHAANQQGTPATPADADLVIGSWPQGAILQDGRGGIWRLEDDSVKPYAGPAHYLSSYNWADPAEVAPGVIDVLRSEDRPRWRDGVLASLRGGVHFMTGGLRRPITSEADFRAFGFKWENVRDASDSEMGAADLGPAMSPSAQTQPDGFLLRAQGTPGVYWIQDGKRRPLASPALFTNRFSWGEVVEVPGPELYKYPEGPYLGFKDHTLVRVPNNSTVWVVSAGMRRPFESADVFLGLGYSFSDVIEVAASEVAYNPVGAMIR